MREQIKNTLRNVPVGTRIERRKVAQQMNTSPKANGGEWTREFELARQELWGEGILFVNRLGGFYERVADEDKGRVAIAQSRRKMKKSLNAARAAQAVLQAAPKTDLDENTRAVMERQGERTAHAAAQLEFIRRQRKFVE